MHDDELIRTQMLIGSEGIDRLRRARVAVFGLGGVGGHALEALARSGVGTLGIFDNDVVVPSNINRQLLATHSTVGRLKVDVAAERIKDINPHAVVKKHAMFYSPDNAESVDLSEYDYVADAIDTVTCKLELICRAKASGATVISCMGTGNKLDPTALRIADISQTSVCPLAKVMRRELKKRGIDELTVVYSAEPPIKPILAEQATKDEQTARRQTPSSIAYLPSVAGLILASAIISRIIKTKSTT